MRILSFLYRFITNFAFLAAVYFSLNYIEKYNNRAILAMAILVETMRREGYELTVGRPSAVTREINGKVHEPFERLSVDVPEEYLGAVTQMIAVRRGRMETIEMMGK